MAIKDEIRILFLGSGFSREIGNIPTQKQFIRNVLKKREDWINNFKVNREPLSNWIRRIGDIEVCMSHLHNLAYSGLASPSSKDTAKKAIINLRCAIRDYLARQSIKKKGVAQDFYKTFIHGSDGRNLAILSVNYDLLVEDVLNENKCKFEYFDIPMEREICRKAIHLYKLHGSTNWMEERKEGEQELIGVEPICVDDTVKVGRAKRHRLKDDQRKGTYRLYKVGNKLYTPILIPFFFQKEEWLGGRWSNIFQRHWSSAENCLCNILGSNNSKLKIYFIGFGLPVADTYLMTWLLKVLEKLDQKNDLRITIICNKKNETLGKALRPFHPKVRTRGLKQYLRK